MMFLPSVEDYIKQHIKIDYIDLGMRTQIEMEY